MSEGHHYPRRRPHTIASLISIIISEQEVPSSVAQFIIIKFLTTEGLKPSEILRRLKVEFGDNTQVYAQTIFKRTRSNWKWRLSSEDQQDWEYLQCWQSFRGWSLINDCWNCFWDRNKLRQCSGNHYWRPWVSKSLQDGSLVFSSKIRNSSVSKCANSWHTTKLKERLFCIGLLLVMKLRCTIAPWNLNKSV